MSVTLAPAGCARVCTLSVLSCPVLLSWLASRGRLCLPPSPESPEAEEQTQELHDEDRQANHAAGTHSITKKYSSIYISYICIICIETLPCGNTSTAALLPHFKTQSSEAPRLSHLVLLFLRLLPLGYFFASHLKSQTPYATYP